MKKLIIVAAIACMAAVSHAADFKWGLDSCDYYDKDGTTYLDYGTAFLYLGTVTASETAFNIGSAVLLATSGFDGDNYIYGNTSTTTSSDSLASDQAGQAFSIILVNKAVASLDGFEGNYAIVDGVSTRSSIPGATVTYYAMFSNSQTVTTASTMAAAPEPTSGLLLLLGVAGLALKRKHA